MSRSLYRPIFLYAVWLAGIAAWGQNAAAPRGVINVIVMEAGLNRPVPDAEVTVAEFVFQPYKYTEVSKAKTDLNGAVRLDVDKFATYIVKVRKPGYSEATGSLGGAQEEVSVDQDHATHSLQFSLARMGEVTGRVVDDETGMPLANFHVQVMGVHFSRGEAIWSGGPVSPTDEDGRFVSPDREPGNYVAQVGPQTLGKDRLMKQFTERDVQTVDVDYGNAYWPGGQGLDSASLVRLEPGGSASVGTIRVRKTSFYRVHVSLPRGSCTPGESMMIDAMMRQFEASSAGEVACGRDFLLRNLQHGSYMLYVLDLDKAQHRKRVVMPFEVTDRNFELKVSMISGPDLGGRILVADGARGPVPATVKIALQTEGRIQFADERAPVTPDADGNFRFSEVPLASERVTVSGLGAGYFVREVRYNGIALNDNIFVTDGGSPRQSLEIVIDDKPATVTGLVKDGDKPVSNADVVLVRWPATSENVFLASKHTTADDNGQFRFAGLAPGEYRVLAVPQQIVPRLDEPNVLFRMLSGADTVTVDRGSSQNLALKATNR